MKLAQDGHGENVKTTIAVAGLLGQFINEAVVLHIL